MTTILNYFKLRDRQRQLKLTINMLCYLYVDI